MKIAGKICPIRSVGKSVISTSYPTEPIWPGWPAPPVIGGTNYVNNPIIVDNLAFCSPACAWFKVNEVDGVSFSEECMGWPTKGDK